jgi:hypothetical protein
LPAASATLQYPYSVDVDDQGNIYIADSWNNRIRKVDGVTGIITNLAGSGVPGNSVGSTGDGGPATSATFTFPWKVKWDKQHSLYITESHRVRKIDLTTNIITTVAGTDIAGYSGDGGSPLLAQLFDPRGLAFNSSGNLFIADNSNNVIREISSTALPTKLLSFEGYLNEHNETMLKWVTVLEEGTSYFEVQYSKNGDQFISLSNVNARGETSSYNYLHCCPAEGNSYYRLRMVDQDGKFSFSRTILVTYTKLKTGLVIFPNPANDHITIEYPRAGKNGLLRIINANGSLVRIVPVLKGSDQQWLSLKGMAKGIYRVQYEGDNFAVTSFVMQ